MYRVRLKRGEPGFEQKLEELKRKFSGVKKSAESETAVNANKQDLKDGYVTFWSDNSDITQLINRSSAYILSVMDCDETVRFHIDRKGFRSCYHAFKLSK
jgi:hypothetical protein